MNYAIFVAIGMAFFALSWWWAGAGGYEHVFFVIFDDYEDRNEDEDEELTVDRTYSGPRTTEGFEPVAGDEEDPEEVEAEREQVVGAVKPHSSRPRIYESDEGSEVSTDSEDVLDTERVRWD